MSQAVYPKRCTKCDRDASWHKWEGLTLLIDEKCSFDTDQKDLR
jgi:hypothetical protein